MIESEKSRWTLVDLVRGQAERLGEKEFLSFEHGTRLTYAGFDRETDRPAAACAARGLVRGDRVLALEKTPTGKVRKQALREAGVTPETWDRESAGDVLARR
jgi:non-ribosomal peptide synthetase component E (peptide arylation enzyme)